MAARKFFPHANSHPPHRSTSGSLLSQAAAASVSSSSGERGDGPFSILDRIRQFQRPISVKEMAALLGVSTDVLYTMVRNQDIPVLKIPGHSKVVFDAASIAFWLRQHNPILTQLDRKAS